MNANLLGNPHSNSPSSILSTGIVESTRLQALAFFNADPEHFDLIFTANATAAIKLVMDCLSDHSQRAASWYSYHADSHTSLVGVRETAGGISRCFMSDEEFDDWIDVRQSQESKEHKLQEPSPQEGIRLFAYPAQSNMNGRRLPLGWSGSIRSSNTPSSQLFTLLDAAAYVTTAQLDLSDPDNAPDFIALSFYKIIGFPDLGALIVRKASSHVLRERRYFGGGTVDMVINGTDTGTNTGAWHAKKSTSLHEMLEDGTPAFHSILALSLALKAHRRIFGSMEDVSKHTCNLITVLHQNMSSLSHANGLPLCKIYEMSPSRYGNSKHQGPTIAFNGKPTGIIRVSLGAMSSMKDIEYFMAFLQLFVDRTPEKPKVSPLLESVESISTETVSLHMKMHESGLKTTVRVEDGTTDFTCPVAACMQSFKTRELLWSHFSSHKNGKTGRNSSSKRGGCWSMRRWRP